MHRQTDLDIYIDRHLCQLDLDICVHIISTWMHSDLAVSIAMAIDLSIQLDPDHPAIPRDRPVSGVRTGTVRIPNVALRSA